MDGGKGNFMEQHHHERSTFSGKLGFVLSAAGASVGLGNIWRFPYLAAKYGGGIFLLIYIILAMTFGYSMIIAETALGRMTKKSPVGAFGKFGKSKWLSFGGWINAIIPILIVPYYSVIGGWVMKYLWTFVSGGALEAADNGGFLWGLLGCCIPIAGLILFLIWKDTKPRTAKAAGIGALVSVILYVLCYVFAAVIGVGVAMY